jgi:hypothetical protein
LNFKRGNHCGIVAKDANGTLKYIAFVFVDRGRQYFIATAMSLPSGISISPQQWQQVQDFQTKQQLQCLLIEIPRPVAAKVYYLVNNHNRDCCYTLHLGQKFETNILPMRVNIEYLG